MIFSSGLFGQDPQTGDVPDDAAGQARFVFENLRALLANGDAKLEDVVHVTVFVRDNSVREALNAEWIKCFPDPADRPARHTLVQNLPGKLLLQIEVVAVVQGV
ncbi:RidA family protein [Paraburkholderia sp. J12]|uniref:RidA family protein n=1 Tax=Paraburkholderia sp. J12 TaxID=2805432 RepID=UPI002ABE659E|nr:RidA family protein [Paraburkholderia sp. J12]